MQQRREEIDISSLLLITWRSMLKRFQSPLTRPKHVRGYTLPKSFTRHGSGSTLITDQGREFVIFLPKNVQNIRRSQRAYFQLSSVLQWNGGKAPPFPPFRPLALCKCELKIGTKSYLSTSYHTEQPLTQPRVTVRFTCCMGGKWFCPVPKI